MSNNGQEWDRSDFESEVRSTVDGWFATWRAHEPKLAPLLRELRSLVDLEEKMEARKMEARGGK